MKYSEKLAKVLLAVFIIVFSANVLYYKIPETEYLKSTVESLEESQNTIMTFSGTTLAASLALSALPDDFGTPLANTISDLNMYFVFILIVVFVEKLIVIEGTKISLAYIIPAACILYVIFMLTSKEVFKKFANKLLILGISLVVVIPFSTHFTETVCDDYLVYVDQTIEETDAGATKINEIMSSSDEEATIFDRLSNAFKTAIQSVSDLLTYFKNIVRKCVNSVAIMIVITFVLPLMILMLFRWLLKELFALNVSLPNVQIRLPHRKQKNSMEHVESISVEE